MPFFTLLFSFDCSFSRASFLAMIARMLGPSFVYSLAERGSVTIISPWNSILFMQDHCSVHDVCVCRYNVLILSDTTDNSLRDSFLEENQFFAQSSLFSER